MRRALQDGATQGEQRTVEEELSGQLSAPGASSQHDGPSSDAALVRENAANPAFLLIQARHALATAQLDVLSSAPAQQPGKDRVRGGYTLVGQVPHVLQWAAAERRGDIRRSITWLDPNVKRAPVGHSVVQVIAVIRQRKDCAGDARHIEPVPVVRWLLEEAVGTKRELTLVRVLDEAADHPGILRGRLRSGLLRLIHDDNAVVPSQLPRDAQPNETGTDHNHIRTGSTHELPKRRECGVLCPRSEIDRFLRARVNGSTEVEMTTPHNTHAPGDSESSAATIGLNDEEAHIVRTTNELARKAVDDRFVAAFLATVAALGLTLGWALHVRADFRDSLPAFSPRTSLPSPLYEAKYAEKKATLPELIERIRASK